MKLTYLILPALATSLLCSCGAEETIESGMQEESIPTEVTVNAETFSLDLENSEAKWDRSVEQSGTTKKIKLFGKMTEVKMGETSFTTNGEAELTEGALSILENELKTIKVTFSVNSLAEDSGESGTFDIVAHPNSTFELSSFEKSDSTMVGTGVIQIEGVKKPITSTLSFVDGDTKTVTGSFLINTTDFPLRTKDSAKSIKKDEIEIEYNLSFK